MSRHVYVKLDFRIYLDAPSVQGVPEDPGSIQQTERPAQHDAALCRIIPQRRHKLALMHAELWSVSFGLQGTPDP